MFVATYISKVVKYFTPNIIAVPLCDVLQQNFNSNIHISTF